MEKIKRLCFWLMHGKEFSHKLNGKDTIITVKVGDAFKNDGALVVPFNDYFDVSLGGNVKKANSIQSKLINEYWGINGNRLEEAIARKINYKKAPFEIGTTIDVYRDGKAFFLLVGSHKKPNNRVTSTPEDLSNSLPKLWEYITFETGTQSTVTIPLIGASHGRETTKPKEDIIKEIIDSYIKAFKKMKIASELIISIFHGDIKQGFIDLYEINKYLKDACSKANQ